MLLKQLGRAKAAVHFSRPLYACRVQAGFPSPADDYLDKNLDLFDHLVEHPEATYLMRANGDSMVEAGIFNNDILVVDRSLTPQDGKVVVAVLDGEFTVKRLRKRDGQLFLEPANANYSTMLIPAESEFTVFGIVRHVIHSV